MRVVVCGGAGYIGSHTCVELSARGHEILILDNFCNASSKVLDHLELIMGSRPQCIKADIRDKSVLAKVFNQFPADVVIHFAALKSVGESWQKPLDYFDNNINGTVTLLRAMREAGIHQLVFSSSATVYGTPDACPISENAPLRVTNPYGRTKLVMEHLIGDLCTAEPEFRAALLRYFNPVGAHPSGKLGEDPSGIPNNLMPYICQVAIGSREHLQVFGNDYSTPDGTGIRDYIHVMDLARAHVDAVDYLATRKKSLTVNLGTGRGYSVLEVAHAFERASHRKIPVQFAPRRNGDVAACYANPEAAANLMGWRAQFDLERMCEDAWRWQSLFPHGYGR